MRAKVAAAAARGATKGLAKNPDVVAGAVSQAAGKAVDAATDAAPAADLAHAADPDVPLGDALGTVLWNCAYLVAATYLRRLAQTIAGS